MFSIPFRFGQFRSDPPEFGLGRNGIPHTNILVKIPAGSGRIKAVPVGTTEKRLFPAGDGTATLLHGHLIGAEEKKKKRRRRILVMAEQQQSSREEATTAVYRSRKQSHFSPSLFFTHFIEFRGILSLSVPEPEQTTFYLIFCVSLSSCAAQQLFCFFVPFCYCCCLS